MKNILRAVGIVFFLGLFAANFYVQFQRGEKMSLLSWTVLIPAVLIAKGWLSEAFAEPSVWEKYEDPKMKNQKPTYHD
jgi:hypothetical protein